ncbi:MAG: hypothetical protein OHK0015_24330 [Chloroflexi bacterium OHK40]
MHPDQLYTTRTLQHNDLLAEAERERQQRQGPGKRPTGSRGLRGLLLAGAGGAGAALLALVISAPWGGPARTGATTQPFNRIFADEARSTPAIEEYLAVLATSTDPGDTLVVRRAPGAPTPVECRLGQLPGLLICAPGVDPGSQGRVTLQPGGPR